MVFIIVLFVFCLDQASKLVVTKNLFLHQSIPVIKDFFHLTLVYNRGAAFGILKNQVYFFIIISLVAIAIILSSLLNQKRHKKLSIHTVALGLILAGATGNLFDRLFLGYVVDFLDFRVWPVFNIADSAITIGAVLLGWGILFGKQKKVCSLLFTVYSITLLTVHCLL